MACDLSSVPYVQLSLPLTWRISGNSDFLLEFLSLLRSPNYPLLPRYWLFSSLLNQLEDALAGEVKQQHIFTVYKKITPTLLYIITKKPVHFLIESVIFFVNASISTLCCI